VMRACCAGIPTDVWVRFRVLGGYEQAARVKTGKGFSEEGQTWEVGEGMG
jgi:hypothetical protein